VQIADGNDVGLRLVSECLLCSDKHSAMNEHNAAEVCATDITSNPQTSNANDDDIVSPSTMLSTIQEAATG